MLIGLMNDNFRKWRSGGHYRVVVLLKFHAKALSNGQSLPHTSASLPCSTLITFYYHHQILFDCKSFYSLKFKLMMINSYFICFFQFCSLHPESKGIYVWFIWKKLIS